jgi:hypothetical protein
MFHRSQGDFEMAKYLPLTNSDKQAIVDDVDYEWASKYAWSVNDKGHVIRDDTDLYGSPAVVYLANEVMSRATGIPLEQFGPPSRS